MKPLVKASGDARTRLQLTENRLVAAGQISVGLGAATRADATQLVARRWQRAPCTAHCVLESSGFGLRDEGTGVEPWQTPRKAQENCG